VFEYRFTERVLKEISGLPEGLKGKIYKYLEMLEVKGYALTWPFTDRIEGYKNLWELRPSFGNNEFRLIFFWKGNTAYFVHSFVEKGQKKKNHREYDTADKLKKMLEQKINH
jgi:hypothetical protein